MLSNPQALVVSAAILSSAAPALAYTNHPVNPRLMAYGPSHALELQHQPMDPIPYPLQHEHNLPTTHQFPEHGQTPYGSRPHEPVAYASSHFESMLYREHEFEQAPLRPRGPDENDFSVITALTRRDIDDILAVAQLHNLVKRGKASGGPKHRGRTNKQLRHKEKHLKHKDKHLEHEVHKLKHEQKNEAAEKRDAEAGVDFDEDFTELVKRASKGGNKQSTKQLKHKEKHLQHKDKHLEHKVDKLKLEHKDKNLKHKEKHLEHEVHKLKHEDKAKREAEADPEAEIYEDFEELVKRGREGKGGHKKHKELKHKDKHLKHKEKHLEHEVHRLKHEDKAEKRDAEAEFVIEAILQARGLEERDVDAGIELEERDADADAGLGDISEVHDTIGVPDFAKMRHNGEHHAHHERGHREGRGEHARGRHTHGQARGRKPRSRP